METTNPGIYHIHIDFHKLCHKLDNYAGKELSFYTADFDGHPMQENGEPYPHFEPTHQLTLKPKTKKEFNEVLAKIDEMLPQCPDFHGYVECEYIPLDLYIPYKEYVDIPIPFHITRRSLQTEKGERFRETEVHITFDKDKSHPNLIQKLLNSGLYAGYIPKKDGNFIVFTCQGFAKEINPLIESIKKFLTESGGAWRATIKEEKVIAYRVCHVKAEDLPEVADTIEYF